MTGTNHASGGSLGDETSTARTYLYVAPLLDAAGLFTDSRLAPFTERHKLVLPAIPLRDVSRSFEELMRDVSGVVIGMHYGWAGRRQMKLAKRALKQGRSVYFYWPKEEAVECIDRERLGSFWRLWFVVHARRLQTSLNHRWCRFKSKVRKLLFLKAAPAPQPLPAAPTDEIEMIREEVADLLATAAPVAFENPSAWLDEGKKISGTGVYLRTDYWCAIDSGGSYTHTCYVAKELAARTDRFVALLANRYALLDDFAIQQVTLPAHTNQSNEEDLLRATGPLLEQVRFALRVLKPAYLYERLCQGNYLGALLSRELKIPYIVEYNGSEISMAKSFAGGSPYKHEDLFLQIEDLAFQQATMISVVSEHLKKSLVARGVDPKKILINPNGVDAEAYAPPSAVQKHALRSELGWKDQDCVVGFTGTFGGWHGIDVLAAALPIVCQRHPEVQFLLIGDGIKKPLISEQIQRHQLSQRVASVGRVPQEEGRRLLGACDVLISPHNAHMVDSRFFGSPTKVFEYMAEGAGIVASDLEQIGQVLSPGLRATQLPSPEKITQERSILCTPGSVEQLADSISYLVQHPDARAKLGQNARQAAERFYTWKAHVERLWHFAVHGEIPPQMSGEPPLRQVAPSLAEENASRDLTKLETGDRYKDETQAQWNDNPCGSQYAKHSRPESLEWFLEVQAHRYGEYAPWMRETMEFSKHGGKKLLEIGGGLGTDLAQFAMNGARVTDIDLSAGHLALARENFRARGLDGEFIHHDAESLPFADGTFDVVYSNGVIHHTPNTQDVVHEIYRVLKPGGRAIIMVYAENSLFYWWEKVVKAGIDHGQLLDYSVGEIMSQGVELTNTKTKPLVKVYTRQRLRNLFSRFESIEIVQCQLTQQEVPSSLSWLSHEMLGGVMGWNLVIRANKPIDAESRTANWDNEAVPRISQPAGARSAA
jgi:glycosyltransferase involved in cell wall biosynthesis/ubiquinone/menaquinone biosynthesis C-methylase UbiE